MKKLAIVAALLAAFNVSAFEVGVVGGGVTGDRDGGLAGVTATQKWGAVSLEGGYAQAWLNNSTQNRWTAVLGYDAYVNPKFVATLKGGYAYLNNQDAASGSALTAGLGLTFPLNNKWALTADYAYQWAESGVTQFNGNVITGGLKYKF